MAGAYAWSTAHLSKVQAVPRRADIAPRCGRRTKPASRSRSRFARLSAAASSTTSPEVEAADVVVDQNPGILKGVRHFSRQFWGGDARRGAWVWTIVTLILALLTTLYSVLLSFVQRMFWTALSSKDQAKFWKLMKPYAVAVIVGPIILTLCTWAKGRASLVWRRYMTQKFLYNYLAQLNYYQLMTNESTAKLVDNPDQRISEDIETFTTKAVEFLCVGFVAVLDFIVFSVILYKIYPPLYYVVLGYSALGTFVTLVFGKKLVSMNSQRLTQEADFRFSLVRVRENAESIAFYRGEGSEQSEIQGRFADLTATIFGLLGFKRNLGFFTLGYKYVINLLPSLVIAPVYFAGNMQLGVISQAYFAFNHVLNDLGIIVNEFVNLSSFSAGLRRLFVFDNALSAKSKDGNITVEDSEESDFVLDVRNLSVLTPTKVPRALAKDLNFTLSKGQRVLVVGESGIGKSSLMRTLAGLWTQGNGEISRPPLASTLFLPQKPYITLGSLRVNATYPQLTQTEYSLGDEEILSALDVVNLSGLADRVGGLDNPDVNLGSMLSLGEQQRLAFCRVLLLQPSFVILDESTSALDDDNERLMYTLIESLGTTCLSVGNRPSLVQFHNRVLRLLPDGGWKVEQPEGVQTL